MEKAPGANDLKGLEEEIDSAVDRLFVEEKKGLVESLPVQSPITEPSLEIETPYDVISADSPEMDEPLVLDQPVLEKPFSEKPFLEKPSARPPSLTPSRKIEEDLFAEKLSLPPRGSIPAREEELSLELRGQDVEQDLFQEKPLPPPRVSMSLRAEERTLEVSGPEVEQDLFAERPSHRPSVSAPVPDPMEKIETQLLSLEWEITNEGIEKTKERIIELRRDWSGQPQILSVSHWMEKVLDSMLKSDANIRPPLIKFLMDAKDTIKVLRQEGATNEISIAKTLAYNGIEARFLGLTGLREAQAQGSFQETRDAGGRGAVPEAGMKRIEEIADQIHRLSRTMQEALEKIEERLSRLEQQPLSRREEEAPRSAPWLTVMVFTLDGRVFGVQNEQVFKLFKVPPTFRDKVVDQQRIRVKNVEVKLVDLKKIFSIREKGRERELKILIVKDDGEYKGLMIEQVLQKVSTCSELAKGAGDYFIGSIPWTYQERPVEISVLDVKRL
jgi:hypothetical protein